MQQPTTWQEIIAIEQTKPYFQELRRFVTAEYQTKTIYPAKENIYRALSLTPIAATKVVILGQDPYIGEHQAHGLSFSVASNQAKFPPSLRNIFQELATDLGVQRTQTDLSDWAQQGVLLLNTVLTVQAGNSNSHAGKGWEIFTDTLITALNDKTEQVVFVLWGNNARSKSKLITNPQHKIIENVHPSPLSAHRGFFGSKPFSAINTYLETAGLTPIDFADK